MTTLNLKNVWKIYEGNVLAVQDLNIEVKDGELFPCWAHPAAVNHQLFA